MLGNLLVLVPFILEILIVIWFIKKGWKIAVKWAMKIRNAVQDEARKYK